MIGRAAELDQAERARLAQLHALQSQLEPWLVVLFGQAEEDLELQVALLAELVNATRDFAQLATRAELRGFANICMLLVRGLSDRHERPLDGEDLAQLSLWLAGVQSYLQGELSDAACLLDDLAELAWIPRLAPAARTVLLGRLSESLPALQAWHAAAQASAAAPSAPVQALEQDLFGAAEADGLFGASEQPLMFAEERTQPDALDATSQTLDASEADLEAIWVAPEEFQLVSETVQARLFPVLRDLVTVEQGHLAEQYAEAQYQIELLSNAFSVLALERLQAMCVRLLGALSAPGADGPALVRARAPALKKWIELLVEYCAQPQAPRVRDLVVDFVASEQWLAPLDPEQAAELHVEMARIRVGLDPALKALRKTEVTAEDMDLRAAEDVMPNVLQGMLVELPENAHALAEHIEGFSRTGDLEHIDAARRIAHTLKGDANTVGIRGIASLTHVLEDIFIDLAKNPGVPSAEFAQLMTEASDCVSAMADHVLGRGAPPADAMDVTQRVLQIANQLAEGMQPVELSVAAARPDNDDEPVMGERPVSAASGFAGGDGAQAIDVPMLQIPADVLDRLLDLSSEALVLLRQIENQIRQVDEGQVEIERQRQEGATLLSELDKMVAVRGVSLQSARVKGDAIDPLELDQYNELYTLTRRLVEVSSDEQSSRNTIERSVRKLNDLSAEQDKVQLELQDRIMRTRQVPVKEFVGRFQRAVRQTSKMLDKDVDFLVVGQETLIDRVQMENLIDPLMHALRNAVDHGIEAQSLRMTRGKPLAGKLKLSFERDGRSVSVRLSDDGAGLNFERIRAKAIASGFMAEGDVVSNEELAQIIVLPGFSTKEEVTQVSGRGIGLDVVYQRIQDLRGTLNIRSQPLQGTTMEIRLPASMTSMYVVLSAMSQGLVAIASDTVENFLLLEPSQCHLEGEQLYAVINGEKLSAIDLEPLILGFRPSPKIPEKTMVAALIRGLAGEAQLGLLAEVKEMRTVIVKDFGPYMRAFPGVRGGTILGDGTVAPVLDARELIRNTVYQPWSVRDESYREQLANVVKPNAVIADDSLSVRRALEQLLSDFGFEVRAARDGLDALSLIKARKPDIMLLDLEMPRMNGLELASHVRKEEGIVDVPIIMITSRTSDKHRKMAFDAGVDEILAKPYSDDALLALIRHHMAARQSPAPIAEVALPV